MTGGGREFSSPGSKAAISVTGIPCLWNHGGDGDLTWREMHGRRERERERERELPSRRHGVGGFDFASFLHEFQKQSARELNA